MCLWPCLRFASLLQFVLARTVPAHHRITVKEICNRCLEGIRSCFLATKCQCFRTASLASPNSVKTLCEKELLIEIAFRIQLLNNYSNRRPFPYQIVFQLPLICKILFARELLYESLIEIEFLVVFNGVAAPYLHHQLFVALDCLGFPHPQHRQMVP